MVQKNRLGELIHKPLKNCFDWLLFLAITLHAVYFSLAGIKKYLSTVSATTTYQRFTKRQLIFHLGSQQLQSLPCEESSKTFFSSTRMTDLLHHPHQHPSSRCGQPRSEDTHFTVQKYMESGSSILPGRWEIHSGALNLFQIPKRTF